MGSCGPAALSAENERVKLSSDLGPEDSLTACSAALVRRALQPVSPTSHSEDNILGHWHDPLCPACWTRASPAQAPRAQALPRRGHRTPPALPFAGSSPWGKASAAGTLSGPTGGVNRNDTRPREARAARDRPAPACSGHTTRLATGMSKKNRLVQAQPSSENPRDPESGGRDHQRPPNAGRVGVQTEGVRQGALSHQDCSPEWGRERYLLYLATSRSRPVPQRLRLKFLRRRTVASRRRTSNGRLCRFSFSHL